MTIENVVDLLGAMGAIATPIILVWLSALGWTFKRKFEISYEREKYIRELEEKLREDRISTYNAILEPFLMAFSTNVKLPDLPQYANKTPVDVAKEIILSLEYKQAAFKLALIGSDEVVKSFNDLMQYFFNLNAQGQTPDAIGLLSRFRTLLIEIRRNMGNVETKIDNFQILEGWIKDIRNLRD